MSTSPQGSSSPSTGRATFGNFRGTTFGARSGQTGTTSPSRIPAAAAAAASSDRRSGQTSPNSRALAVEPGGTRGAAGAGRTRSPVVAVARDPMASLGGNHPLDEVLDIVRKGSSDKSRPLVIAVLRMEEFYKKLTGNVSPHCAELLDSILWSVATGRKIEGDDATTHLGHLAKKLESPDAKNSMLEVRNFLIAEVKSQGNAAMILPWVQEGANVFKNSNNPRATSVSAEDIADKLLSKVSERSIKRYFAAELAMSGEGERLIFESIAATGRAVSRSHPGYAALCTYLLEHGRHPSTTEANAQLLLSAALKAYSKNSKIPTGDFNADGTPKLKTYIHYAIPAASPMGRAIQGIKWADSSTGQAKSFAVKRDENNVEVVEVPTFDRRHLIKFFFTENKSGQIAPARVAGLAVFAEVADDKRK